MSSDHQGSYYLPEPTYWPIIGSIALFCFLIGFANLLHHHWFAPYLMGFGGLLLIYMMFGWFGTVIRESRAGLFDHQVDKSFRWGMIWFIFSEVLFFGAFFGALFYARVITVPWLSGNGQESSILTHLLLWPNFQAHWPLLKNPDGSQFVGPHSVMEAWGLPAINTLLLLSSGVTITWAHWSLLANKRKQLIIGMICTVLLGVCFLALQAHEYDIAYTEKALTLHSGIFGTTFFLLTGFHGLHVTIGTIMLIVITIRCMRGHFDEHNHFGFEAVSWYWHFVDVVWLGLFIFVYWL
ncbi:MAG: cytochrome c oxidase subunit 3 [Legionellales bacterium]|nr:cytochrome c oxidase subunit 3 [Legionellales bacterium]